MAAIERGQTWLSAVLAGGWDEIADYPYNSRHTVDPAFATMAATALWGSSLPAGFESGVANGPGPAPSQAITSDTFVVRQTGDTYIDRYRHVAYAWNNPGLAASYAQADFPGRVLIRQKIADGLSQHFVSKRGSDQEWMLAEITFAQTRLLEATSTAALSN